jgi:hypothetical protein
LVDIRESFLVLFFKKELLSCPRHAFVRFWPRAKKEIAFLLRILLLVVAAVILSSWANASEFNVRSFGAVGDGRTDDGPALQHTIDAAIKSGTGASIVIPAGHYRLGSSLPDGNAQLRITGAASLTITGQGKVLLMSAEPRQHIIAVEHSSNIRIAHLAMDRSPLLFSQGLVTTIGPSRRIAQVAIEPGYDGLNAPLIQNDTAFIVFSDPRSGTWGDHSAACSFYKPTDPSVCWPPTINGRRRIRDNIWEVTLNAPLQTGDLGKRVVIWSGNAGENKGRALLLQQSENVHIDDVHFYGGGGDGFMINQCKGIIELSNFTIGLPTGSDRLIAGTAGGMIFNNHAHIVLNHVSITNVWDDDINIGANYARIYTQTDPNSIQVDGARDDFRVGDRVAIMDWVAKSVIATVRIASVDCRRTSHPVCDLRLDRAMRASHTGFAETKSKGNDTDGIDRAIDLDSAGQLTVEHSQFQSLHARCLLVRSSGSRITDSSCSDTVLAGIVLGPEFYWDEGPQVRDDVIDNNVFRNVSGPNILVTDGGAIAAAGAQNIEIKGNVFVDFGRYSHGIMVKSASPILLQKVDNPIISDNRGASKYFATLPPLVSDLKPAEIIQ